MEVDDSRNIPLRNVHVRSERPRHVSAAARDLERDPGRA